MQKRPGWLQPGLFCGQLLTLLHLPEDGFGRLQGPKPIMTADHRTGFGGYAAGKAPELLFQGIGRARLWGMQINGLGLFADTDIADTDRGLVCRDRGLVQGPPTPACP